MSQRYVCEQYHIRNPATFRCENGRYLASIIDDSAVTFDELIESYDEETKLFEQVLMKRKPYVKDKIFTFYLHFY